MTRPPAAGGLRWSLWTIRAATAAALAIDAHVHLDLAAVYGQAGRVISEGVPFRAEAVAGLLAATPPHRHRTAALSPGQAGGLGSALAVMLVARNVDLGQIGGPLPNPETGGTCPGARGRLPSRRRLTHHGQPPCTFRLDDASSQAHGNNFTDHSAARPSPGTPLPPAQPRPRPASSVGYNPYQGGSSGYWPAPPGIVAAPASEREGTDEPGLRQMAR